MEDYTISVTQVEELQTIKDIQALETIMERARRTIIGGSNVLLCREQRGEQYVFETITNESDFEKYREGVFRYL